MQLIVKTASLAAWLVVLAAIFVPLERAFALSRARVFRRQWWVDLGWYFLNGLVPVPLLAPIVALAAQLAAKLMPQVWLDWVATWPTALRAVIALAVADLGSYWAHRFSHEWPLLWRFHRIHHSAEHMDWLVNSRGHPVDFVVTRLLGLMPVYALGLAGQRPETQGVTLFAITVFGTVWTFFIHANVRWRLGWFERWGLSTPAFHHWHHTMERANIDRNFAAVLPLYDRLFGTLYLPRRWPEAYGIEEPVPATLGGQLLDPFLSPPSPRAVASGGVKA